jgi:hypothetical protein
MNPPKGQCLMDHRPPPFVAILLLLPAVVASAVVTSTGQTEQNAPSQPESESIRSGSSLAGDGNRFFQTYCLDCHNRDLREGGFSLAELTSSGIVEHTPEWETVIRKLATRQMPPSDAARPTEAQYITTVDQLTEIIDGHAKAHPRANSSESLRRLNRTEYRNAIRDLLALQMDVEELLPADESSHGFDNVTVTDLSPALLDRYLSAARTISRLAVGRRGQAAAEATYRVRPDVTQDTHIPGTPPGTRGGMVIQHQFPLDGEYEIQVWLMRDRNEEVEGLRGTYDLEFLVDKQWIATSTIAPPARGKTNKSVDENLIARSEISAGPHEITVTFPKNPSSLLESVRQPLNVHYNYYRHPRLEPAIYQVTIRGPYDAAAASNTPSRRRIFHCYPQQPEDENQCAEQVLTSLMRSAYRREVTADDLVVPMQFYREGRHQSDFDAGIERALSAILVNPNFLFRVERTPHDLPPGTVYPLPTHELASRLAFFLWSSIPDQPLLDAASDGSLLANDAWERQVRRMLADTKSESLAENFAGQWLYLRNLEAFVPDMRLYPDFDDNLRQALRRETELLFDHVVRADRSVLELLRSDYTFLNERLAKHYEIPHVYGSHFRRVEMQGDTHRGGLLRHGSILTVTSYATRTSPVKRGSWVLENILGTPPPPPPPNVPALEQSVISESLPVRQRLERHRADAACATCHNTIDPVGFALENYDAIGHWRTMEQEQVLDVSGGLPDGSQCNGITELEDQLLERPELFVQALTEKLMTFALGRGIEPHDMPSIRQIVRDAKQENYRFSRIVLGITKSVSFRMRKSP